MQSLRDFKVRGKRVLARCDFNVPLNEQGIIMDDFRIRQTLLTITHLISQNAKIILLSHLGNPGGKVVENLSLKCVQERLSEYLGRGVLKTQDCIGAEAEEAVRKMANGDILLLENLRFHIEEERNEPAFAKSLARLGEIFINDAFSSCHRSHASIVGIPQFLPSGAGMLLEKEVETLSAFLQNRSRPFVVIVGGKKVKDKLSFIDHISKRADAVLLGNLIFEEAKKQGKVFQNADKIVCPVDGLPKGEQAFDIGPKTIQAFAEKIKKAKLIFWTGPLGWVEKEEYAKGSLAIAQAIGESKAYAIAGGGDVSSFLDAHDFTKKFAYVSTGGGATLEFLAGEQLPGLQALGYYD